MVGEREHLRFRGSISELLGPVDQVENGFDDPRPVGLLRGETRFESQPPGPLRRRQPGERSALQAGDLVGLGHRAMLVEPDPAAPERRIGERDVVILGFGHRGRFAEEGTRRGQATARQHGIGPFDEKAGTRLREARAVARRDRVAEELSGSFRRAGAAERPCGHAACVDRGAGVGGRPGGRVHGVRGAPRQSFHPRDALADARSGAGVDLQPIGIADISNDRIAYGRVGDAQPTILHVEQSARPRRVEHVRMAHLCHRRHVGRGCAGCENTSGSHDASMRRREYGDAMADDGLDATLGEDGEPPRVPAGESFGELDLAGRCGQSTRLQVRRDSRSIEVGQIQVDALPREVDGNAGGGGCGRVVGGDDHRRQRVEPVGQEMQELDPGPVGVVQIVEHDGRGDVTQDCTEPLDRGFEMPEAARARQLGVAGGARSGLTETAYHRRPRPQFWGPGARPAPTAGDPHTERAGPANELACECGLARTTTTGDDQQRAMAVDHG